jgi:hypothetical protein
MIRVFEAFKPEMEFHNEIKEVLLQYPYLTYSIKEDDGFVVTFSKNVPRELAISILKAFKIKIVTNNPISIKVLSKRNIESYDEFNGKKIIGNIEKIDIEELNMVGIESKIDSGATTSSIDCSEIKIDEVNKKVTFIPLRKKYKQFTGNKVTLPLEGLVNVQSSNGDTEKRPLVKLTITLGKKETETFFSLSDRKELEYPILIGKDVLGNYLIDTSHI